MYIIDTWLKNACKSAPTYKSFNWVKDMNLSATVSRASTALYGDCQFGLTGGLGVVHIPIVNSTILPHKVPQYHNLLEELGSIQHQCHRSRKENNRTLPHKYLRLRLYRHLLGLVSISIMRNNLENRILTVTRTSATVIPLWAAKSHWARCSGAWASISVNYFCTAENWVALRGTEEGSSRKQGNEVEELHIE